MKPGNPPLQSVRLLDQLRERIRYMHYSLSTEKVYLYWVRLFIRWSGRNGQMLATERIRTAPEVRDALSAVA
ncbi:MAG: phage integrase N-terminal SAM-like domain-containing protein [Rhodoferax sp.]|nr:phage integrase N-terminal SAM-like domain-containing protein [Rhodoferax sp.]